MKLQIMALMISLVYGVENPASLIWKKTFGAEGCGNNYYQAKSKASAQAKAASAHYELSCQEDDGNYVIQYRDGYCVEDPENPTCRVSCSTIGIASCWSAPIVGQSQ